MTMKFTLQAFGAAALLLFTQSTQAAVTISTNATKNIGCSGGICTPSAKKANLNVDELEGMLASSDVTVKTGAGAISIGVLKPLAWSSTHRLRSTPSSSSTSGRRSPSKAPED